MTSRFFAIGALAALTAISAVSAVGPMHSRLVPYSVSGNSPLHAYGSRSLQQVQSSSGSKFDATLADISRHLNRVRADHAMADLHVLSLGAKFAPRAADGAPMVAIDAITRGDPQQLKAALVELGLQHPAVYSNDVGGWLPVSQLDAAAARAEVHAMRAALSRTHTGAVTSQGDFVQHSDIVRSANTLTGAGITVGVLSDSFDCYPVYAQNGVPANGNAGYARLNGITTTAAMDVSTGDLPSSVNVIAEAQCLDYGPSVGGEPNGDEGRAMLQIVHDVAPGASLAFYTADNSEADFASGIGKLATAGAKIIADDVGYFDEPFFQDGIVAQAIDAAEAQGVAYFTSAGNNGTLAYDNTNPKFNTLSGVPGGTFGEYLLNFDTTGATATTTLPVSLPLIYPGDFIAVVVEWDQPYVTGAPNSGGATSQINVCVSVSGNDEIANDNLEPLANNCSGVNQLGSDPVQVVLIGNPSTTTNSGSNPQTLNIQVALASGGTTPGRIKVAVEGDGYQLTFNSLASASPTIQGHSSAAGAMSIGAALYFDTPACGTTPAALEYYSSAGGDPILFNVNGQAQAAVIRQKPDVVGPDGGSDTFLGQNLGAATTTIVGCENGTTFPNFQGTSAATPHVASIAALLLQADPTLTPTQIYTVLHQTALPMGGATPNLSSGYGFAQADAAFAMIPGTVPAAPTLTLGSSSIVAGTSTTLTWNSANTTGCTASGTWTGAMATTGSQTLTPTAAGSDTYSLLCSNATGSSTMTSVTLTVTAASSGGGGGGGGAMGLAALLGLAGMCWGRVRRYRLNPRGR